MRKSTFITGLLLICGFVNLNLFAQQTAFNNQLKFISPSPGAQYATTQHNITLRFSEALNLNSIAESSFTIIGSLSGAHSGEIDLTTDAKTLIFKPATPFQYNETVTVNVHEGIQTQSGIEIAPVNYSFRIMKEDNTHLRNKYMNWLTEENQKMLKKNYVPEQPAVTGKKTTMELPEDYPPYSVSILNNPAPGYIFMNPHNYFHPSNTPSYTVIMDHYGTPVYYKRFDTHCVDYKIQETGDISQFIVTGSGGLGIGYGTFHTYDMNMNPIDTFQMGNGYLAEMHDFQLFNDGSYLLFTYDAQVVDMSQIVDGGDPAATVMGCVLQELDADDNVVFEWSSWDHLEITDATPDIDLTGVFIDYCHANAVERDDDGNILVSFRNTDEIVKINRTTGDLMWRWNTNREDLNDIEFLNDTIGFSHQHDIRRQENGNLSMFDNGNLHGPPPYTRILEYTVDEVNMTAEAVSVYPPSPGPGNYFAFATGSAHHQPNGNTTIGWGLSFGSSPLAGEITPEGQVTLEMFGIDTIGTYRAHKFVWEPTMFSISKDSVDWGEYTGYTPEPYILQVTNNSPEAITVSGTHKHTEEFYVTTTFPLAIDPGATENIIVNFFPAVEGNFEDVLTVMVAKGEFEMIGKQIVLLGHTADESAPEASFDPEDGALEIIRMPKLKLSFNEKLFKEGGEMITNQDLQDIVFLNKDLVGIDDVPFKAWISWYDNKRTEIMIQPFDYLDSNTEYFWGVQENTVEDWAGNGISEIVYAAFTTGEEMGVDDILVNEFARVFPNPTNGVINLEFINNDDKSVTIYNVSGNKVLNADHLTGLFYNFDISDQPEGIYIVRVINLKTNSSVEMKVIKR